MQLAHVVASAGVRQPDGAVHHGTEERGVALLQRAALLGEVGLERGRAVELVDDRALGAGHEHRLAGRAPAVVDADAHRRAELIHTATIPFDSTRPSPNVLVSSQVRLSPDDAADERDRRRS